MNAKMKSCFTPHVLMHSLFGLGLGILLTIFVPAVQTMWVALGIMALAVILDMLRK